MLRFTSLLWVWKGEAAGRWYFLTVPEDQSVEIKAAASALPRGFGSVKVEAVIAHTRAAEAVDIRWRTSVFPLNSGGFILPIKAEIRKRAGLAAGDEVKVALTLLD